MTTNLNANNNIPLGDIDIFYGRLITWDTLKRLRLIPSKYISAVVETDCENQLKYAMSDDHYINGLNVRMVPSMNLVSYLQNREKAVLPPDFVPFLTLSEDAQAYACIFAIGLDVRLSDKDLEGFGCKDQIIRVFNQFDHHIPKGLDIFCGETTIHILN
jgi:hypothetical protein